MGSALIFLTAILFAVSVIVLVNEKFLKLADEIVLLIFSLLGGIVLLVVVNTDAFPQTQILMNTISRFRIDKVLLEVFLCFMLFTGASELKLKSLVNNFKPICLLALLTTVITATIYGGLFYLVTRLLGMDISFTLCFLLGSIVSPTDPIAATGILGRMGLTKNVTAIMEGESLFNDGTGVALFIFIKGILLDDKGSNFAVVMCRELFGAVIVGLVVSFLFSLLIRATMDPVKHIIISMMTVAFCYTVCDHFGFSGVIASVICGIYFSTMMDRYRVNNEDWDPSDYYKDFWTIMDKLLNYVLYVMIGISFVYVTRIPHLIVVAIAAIVINLVSRYIGVLISTIISRQQPDNYKLQPFTILMTWSGLKGGLCLALAMSIADILTASEYGFVLYVTFITIIFTTVIQGLTVGKVFTFVQKKSGLLPEDNSKQS